MYFTGNIAILKRLGVFYTIVRNIRGPKYKLYKIISQSHQNARKHCKGKAGKSMQYFLLHHLLLPFSLHKQISISKLPISQLGKKKDFERKKLNKSKSVAYTCKSETCSDLPWPPPAKLKSSEKTKLLKKRFFFLFIKFVFILF